jgi:hypothetical protein
LNAKATKRLVDAQHDGLLKHARAIEILMATLYGRSFLGRLRWLVFGR